MNTINPSKPGPLLLFGSGETMPASGKAYEQLNRIIGAPPVISILETPAGFQPNSEKVAAEVGDYLKKRLQNYQPHVEIIPARHKALPFSTEDPRILAPLLRSNWVFMGPGSPTYAIRHLKGSLALEYLRALHMQGSALCLASAAVLAISKYTLPVYEIYKVGEDPFWAEGLDFLAPFGLDITFIPHWNNRDGGAGLDTSRCFMGRQRFERMLVDLPRSTLVGIDEQTSLLIEFGPQPICRVYGKGKVTIFNDATEKYFSAGEDFQLNILGNYHLPDAETTPSAEIMSKIEEENSKEANRPADHVHELVRLREEARARRDWGQADQIRAQLLAEGWLVADMPEGPTLSRRD